ncbi:Gfo/Idh/MocA family protein [Aestuariimicrobium kwangyangense]|uniref:Gfo/Idh/MocA family protein n=1 Tax=Aestuariimicrobium kwangyangense TaxID=396389 RepID=UPI0003B66192|nr:Gfo/Idh/MocA family oxidoreductase [Aestuariimicrobium kwangyangense]
MTQTQQQTTRQADEQESTSMQGDHTDQRRLKVAVMSFAHPHAAGYVHLLQQAGVDVLACDPDRVSSADHEVRGADLAAQLGVAHVDTYEELFAWAPDAVVICSENTRHRQDTELAAAHGVHVLCEKPLAVTAADARAMIDACERAGVLLMTAYPVHFSPAVTAAKQAIAEGTLGQLIGAVGTNNGYCPVGARRWFLNPEWSGGGALVDHTVHVAELLDWLTGDRPASVHAVKNQIMHADLDGVLCETGGLVTITYEQGLVATIDCSWSVPKGAPTWGGVTLELAGTNGVLEINPFAQRVGGWDGNAGGRDFWLPYGANLDDGLLRTFIDAVQARRAGEAVEWPSPDGHVGLRTAQIVEAAQVSARKHRVVQISELA